MASSKQTLYFGYGSNLWRDQMQKRCPESTYLGLARLKDFRWIINDRGYANVVEKGDAVPLQSGSEHENEVWGLVYSLSESDEERLDVNEGVPVAYTKEYLAMDFWRAKEEGGKIDVDREAERVEMLVYIDRKRVVGDVPKKEYVYRMNMGIRDALAEGMPEGYVNGVMRKFIPADGEGEAEGKEVEELAKKQAERFEDED